MVKLGQRLGLINQHDGNIILNLVEKFALITDQTILKVI